MSAVTIQEARARLTELIRRPAPGDEPVITDDDRPVAELVPAAAPLPGPRRPGTLRRTVPRKAPDFDEPLDDSRIRP